MKRLFLLLGLSIVVATSAFAQICPGPNTQTVQLPPYHYTYESWVTQSAGDSAFTFGVCIKNLATRSAFIWEKAQLSPATPLNLNQTASATFSFAVSNHQWVKSELKYGFPQPDRALTVNLLAVAEDPPTPGPSPPTSMAVRSTVADWQTRAVSLPIIDTTQWYTRTSKASIPIGDDSGKAAELAIEFSSYLPLKGDYVYRLSYSFAQKDSRMDTANTSFQISFPLISAAMRRAKVVSGDSRIRNDGEVTLLAPGGQVQFSYRYSDGATTMQVGRLELKRSGLTIASLPISFYVPVCPARGC